MSANRRAWMIVLVGALCAVPLWLWRGGRNRPGTTLDAAITLVTSDRDDLSCGLDRAIGPLACEFGNSGDPAPARMPADRHNLLAPYMTVSRQLFLIPDLFGQPAIDARFKQEPPAGVPRQQLRRFVARCRLRLIEQVESLSLRWERSGTWGPASDAWVAQASDCRVEN